MQQLMLDSAYAAIVEDVFDVSFPDGRWLRGTPHNVTHVHGILKIFPANLCYCAVVYAVPYYNVVFQWANAARNTPDVHSVCVVVVVVLGLWLVYIVLNSTISAVVNVSLANNTTYVHIACHGGADKSARSDQDVADGCTFNKPKQASMWGQSVNLKAFDYKPLAVKSTLEAVQAVSNGLEVLVLDVDVGSEVHGLLGIRNSIVHVL